MPSLLFSTSQDGDSDASEIPQAGGTGPALGWLPVTHSQSPPASHHTPSRSQQNEAIRSH